MVIIETSLFTKLIKAMMSISVCCMFTQGEAGESDPGSAQTTANNCCEVVIVDKEQFEELLASVLELDHNRHS